MSSALVNFIFLKQTGFWHDFLAATVGCFCLLTYCQGWVCWELFFLDELLWPFSLFISSFPYNLTVGWHQWGKLLASSFIYVIYPVSSMLFIHGKMLYTNNYSKLYLVLHYLIRILFLALICQPIALNWEFILLYFCWDQTLVKSCGN